MRLLTSPSGTLLCDVTRPARPIDVTDRPMYVSIIVVHILSVCLIIYREVLRKVIKHHISGVVVASVLSLS